MSRFIRKLHLRNLLSFEDCEVELQDLNVLIGPNGAGKSNLIEAVGLLRSLPLDLEAYLRQGGGRAAWVWKGSQTDSAQVETTLDGGADGELTHSFQIVASAGGLTWEQLARSSDATPVFLREFDRLKMEGTDPITGYGFPESVFFRYRLPSLTSRIGENLATFRIYREFRTGKNDPVRLGLSVSASHGPRLNESGDNLAAILHELDLKDKLDAVRDLLHEINPAFGRVKPRLHEGAWFIQLAEDGLLDPIPSQRISDGTLKFLCLAAVLLDPDPPPVVCIEEPETGLHPEALRVVANLIREASSRMQLLITTHSADLINELSSTPDAVLVAEKNEHNATTFTRLNPDELEPWLERYQLGELLQKGQIGGNRW